MPLRCVLGTRLYLVYVSVITYEIDDPRLTVAEKEQSIRDSKQWDRPERHGYGSPKAGKMVPNAELEQLPAAHRSSLSRSPHGSN